MESNDERLAEHLRCLLQHGASAQLSDRERSELKSDLLHRIGTIPPMKPKTNIVTIVGTALAGLALMVGLTAWVHAHIYSVDTTISHRKPTTTTDHTNSKLDQDPLFRHVPNHEVTQLSEIVKKFPTSILLPTTLPFEVTMVTESLFQTSSSSTLHVDFSNPDTKQSLVESVISYAGTYTAASEVFMFPGKTVHLRHGINGMWYPSRASNQLDWVDSPNLYTLTNRGDGRRPMTLHQMESIANTMKVLMVAQKFQLMLPTKP